MTDEKYEIIIKYWYHQIEIEQSYVQKLIEIIKRVEHCRIEEIVMNDPELLKISEKYKEHAQMYALSMKDLIFENVTTYNGEGTSFDETIKQLEMFNRLLEGATMGFDFITNDYESLDNVNELKEKLEQ